MDWRARLDELNRAFLANLEHAAPSVLDARIEEAEIEKVRYQQLVNAPTEGLAGQHTGLAIPARPSRKSL
jgi:hypothetical protein